MSNWIYLFQFCFEAQGWHKGRESFVEEQRSVVPSSPLNRVTPSPSLSSMSVSSLCSDSDFIVPSEEALNVGERVWPTCRHLRSGQSRGGGKQKRLGLNQDQDISIFSFSNRSWSKTDPTQNRRSGRLKYWSRSGWLRMLSPHWSMTHNTGLWLAERLSIVT